MMRMLIPVVTPALARMASWLLPVICSAFSLRLVSSLSSTHWSLQPRSATATTSRGVYKSRPIRPPPALRARAGRRQAIVMMRRDA